MPIPSHNFGAVLFLSELGLACHLFSRSISKLERAAEHWRNVGNQIDDGQTAAPIEIVSDCTVCLSSMAAIRRILRPAPKAKHKAKRRAEALLKLLDDPPLANVTSVGVRNSWEHLDERLDDWLAERQAGFGSVSEIHVSVKPPEQTTKVLRRFDPNGFAIHFSDTCISLRPCQNEIADLKQRINKAYLSLQAEKVEV